MEIVNIIAVAKMKEKFDLEELSNRLDNTENTAVWLKMRLKPENYYIAFYSSGKFLITGIKTLDMLNIISKRVLKLLYDAGVNNSVEKVEIKNIVMTDEIQLKSSLNDIIISLNTSSASYEPEQFPGLFYKDTDGISFTLFSSGKIVITGFIDEKLASNNLKKFKNLITSIF